MEVKEWRLGNLTYYNNKVYPIDLDDFVDIYEDPRELIKYKPILLDEDWLIKFGILKWLNKEIWSKKGVMIYHHSKDGWCYGKARTRVKIKHVHQLQNLYFALTGNELTIN